MWFFDDLVDDVTDFGRATVTSIEHFGDEISDFFGDELIGHNEMKIETNYDKVTGRPLSQIQTKDTSGIWGNTMDFLGHTVDDVSNTMIDFSDNASDVINTGIKSGTSLIEHTEDEFSGIVNNLADDASSIVSTPLLNLSGAVFAFVYFTSKNNQTGEIIRAVR